MITLKETIFFPNGKETKIVEQSFNSKSHVIKVIKKHLPLSGEQIFELSKNNECECNYGNLRRKLEIIEERK
jgi:hypothetical protein